MFKSIKKKTSLFTLEPDGFSIHTFELSRKLTESEFKQLRSNLYDIQKATAQKQKVYKDDHGTYCCNLFNNQGMRIRLETGNTEKCTQYHLRITVNPKRLINPGGDWREVYLGILPPEKECIRDVSEAFTKVFKDTEVPQKVNDYKLSRLDLCVNIRSDKKKIFREMVRVLRKLPTPEKYERKFYTCADRKAANAYNKHYLRFVCGTHELVIYDKTYQITANDLALAYEKLPEGVLRIEMHCGREYLRKIEKKRDISSTLALLELMMEESEERIVGAFSRCFHAGMFCHIGEIERRINVSRFDSSKKSVMIELSRRMQRIQNLDKALKSMKKEDYDTEGILGAFQGLNINPTPLRKNFAAPYLPGIVELLQGISDGAVPVEYIRIKNR